MGQWVEQLADDGLVFFQVVVHAARQQAQKVVARRLASHLQHGQHEGLDDFVQKLTGWGRLLGLGQ